MFAVGVFGLVAIGAIGIMNRGLYNAQKALEISMARNEIDAQAEALRFIHGAYVSERSTSTKTYTDLWNSLISSDRIYAPSELPANFSTGYNNNSCGNIYSNNQAFTDKAFVINTRRLDTDTVASSYTRGSLGNCIIIQNATAPLTPLEQTPTYPRLLFGAMNWSDDSDPSENLSENDLSTTHHLNLQKAQGIWITAVASETLNVDDAPEYYDFYIRTCWYAPGSNDSSTISTTVRLFNPDL